MVGDAARSEAVSNAVICAGSQRRICAMLYRYARLNRLVTNDGRLVVDEILAPIVGTGTCNTTATPDDLHNAVHAHWAC